MRHNLIPAMAAAAILAAACTDTPDHLPGLTATDGSTTIRAMHATTRTDFDGTATSWAEGDAMSVFIVGDGLTTRPYRFDIDDPSTGTFTCDAITLDPAAAYDFYAVYPYNADKGDIGSDDARFNIGAAAQTQHGNSAAHVAPLDPLIGCAKGLSADAATLLMRHTATVIRLRLQNATGAAIPGIKSVTLTAPDGVILAVPHAIDLAAGTVTPDTDMGTSTITLAVDSSGEIPADGEFSCWMAATPFSMNGGDDLRIEVATDDGSVYRITKRFDTGKSFPAGTVMSSDAELSPATEAAESITLGIDFTNAATYPEGFPTSKNPASGEGEYTFAGHTFRIISKGPYYFNSNSGYLAIEDIQKGEPADIALPIIEGYAPTQITVTAHETCKGRPFVISVTDSAGSTLSDTSEKNTSMVISHTFSPTDTDDHSEYRIHVVTTNNNNRYKFPLSALSITYKRI